MNKYQQWITDYKGDIFRKCKEVTIEMQSIFPELRIAKGLVQIVENLKWYQHQWLVDSEENIVDPTAAQWEGILEYREIKEGEPRPVGKCMNCGEFVFSDTKFGSEICSAKCYSAFTQSMKDYT
jgi:hypothetical protein